MIRTPVILIFDVGKTNKKLLLFNQQYKIIFEESIQLNETVDEDGFACENIISLSHWILENYKKYINSTEFEVRAINFSAYGASVVLIDEMGAPCFPLYNYLKPYPIALQHSLYEKYGGEEVFCLETASPSLGNLNSGLQLYRLKVEKKIEFEKVQFALHLPQYLSYLLTNKAATDITSIGCHTSLWDFQHNRYHRWAHQEGIANKFAPICKSDDVVYVQNDAIAIGRGLHDSSSALIPYLKTIKEPFLFISTGTWSISLNPFNQSPLTKAELEKDTLFYLSSDGIPVKASRLFAGREHELQTKRIADFYGVEELFYESIQYDQSLVQKLKQQSDHVIHDGVPNQIVFSNRDLHAFANYQEAYHQLIIDIVHMQIRSTDLVLHPSSVKSIYVDGGFSNNQLFMQLIASHYVGYNIYAASVAQASALGAAVSIHEKWNDLPLPQSLIHAVKLSAD